MVHGSDVAVSLFILIGKKIVFYLWSTAIMSSAKYTYLERII